MSFSTLLVTNTSDTISISNPRSSLTNLPVGNNIQRHPSLSANLQTDQSREFEERISNFPSYSNLIRVADSQLDLGIEIGFPVPNLYHSAIALASLPENLPEETSLITYSYAQTRQGVEKVYISSNASRNSQMLMTFPPRIQIGAYIIAQNWNMSEVDADITMRLMAYLDLFIVNREVKEFEAFLVDQLLNNSHNLPSAIFIAALHLPQSIYVPNLGIVIAA